MASYKCSFVIFLLIITVCLAQDESQGVARKRYKHKLHHLYHNPYFYYLAFLVVKMKFAFVVGSMILIALFASKSYALLKYGILSQKNKEPEKIYIQASEHYPHYSISDDDHHEFASSSSGVYGRSFPDSIANNLDLLENLVQKFDLNDLALDSMNITDKECKQRFVCEANMQAKENPLLGIEMILIRDDNFNNFKTDETFATMDDCAKLCS